MKYQRVLYTSMFTTELKSKLRIVSYNKRRSLKGNVYYVSFASDADIEYAERISRHLRNVILKPFQPRSTSEAQREKRIGTCGHQESLASSFIPSSSIPFSSPPTSLTSLNDCLSTSITSESHSLRSVDEALEERAIRVLGSLTTTSQSTAVKSTLQESNLDRKQIIDNVQSCLSTMETVRRVADELCQLHKSGVECCQTLNYFLKIHSTAFYLKATTSAQIKAAFYAGLRLPWSAVANSVNAIRADIRHEQAFMTQVASAKYISSKIDNAASVAVSSKLAYHLTKLSA